MNASIVKTALILLFTLLVIPIITFNVDESLTQLQRETLNELALLAFGAAMLCFTVSELTGNCSQVDKLWSILPILYAWYTAYAGSFDSRLVLMAVLVSIWGARLTYNFSRRGAYKLKFWEGEEDYRWEILRRNPALQGTWRWRVFNLFFISLYQNALILAFTLPMVVVMRYPGQGIGALEMMLAAAYVFFVILETQADQHQWEYQNEKHRRLRKGIAPEGEYALGFVQRGLWNLVRHPNYMCEQLIWIVFYVFSVAASGHIVNWSMAGCLLLLVLFQGSADFSEGISAGKYPAYAEYKQRAGRFFPNFKTLFGSK
jgi:steroid 5-alpha reductase family enzyme